MTDQKWIKVLLVVNALFLGYLIFFGGRSANPAGNMSGAVRLFEKHLSEGNHQAAYDLFLAATRLAPSDARLIDMVERFAKSASASSNPGDQDLAEEILARSQALVHFQRPTDVVDVRSRLNAMMVSQPTAAASGSEDSPSATDLLAVVRNQDLPMEVRYEALEQARSDLDSTIFDAAVAGGSGTNPGLRASQQQAKDGLAAAERVLLGDVLQKLKGEIDALGEEYVSISAPRTTGDHSDPEPLTADVYADLDKRLAALQRKGMALLQQAGPLGYLLDDSDGPRDDTLRGYEETTGQLDKQVALIQSKRVFYYNQYVMQQLEEIRSRDKDAVDALVALLSHEDWFMDFVAEKFNEKWKAAVERLSDTGQLEAMQKLVLQTLQNRK